MKVRDLNTPVYTPPLHMGDMVHTPIIAGTITVPCEWVDYNGHMNEAYYITVASQGFEFLMQYIGMDRHFVAERATYFTLENHNTYMQECNMGDVLTSVGHVLDCSEKCIHVYYDVYNGPINDKTLVFSMEQIKLLVDAKTHKKTVLPPIVFARLQAICDAHKSLPPPQNVSQKLQIYKKS